MTLIGLPFAGLAVCGAALCRVLPKRFYGWVLSACAVVWAVLCGAESAAVLAAALAVGFFGGRLLTRLRRAGRSVPAALWACVGAELLLMLYGRGRVTGASFYGLMLLGYLADCAWGECGADVRPQDFAAGAAFFPLLTEGPVVRLSRFLGEVTAAPRASSAEAGDGLCRIVWGLVKKLILAERLTVAVDAVYAEPGAFSAAAVWTAVVLSCFEMYADFSGCMDIVLGAAALFGLHPGENFRQPYLAASFSEYWKRWHITMGAWFKTFVFYPLAASRPALALNAAVCKRTDSPTARRMAAVTLPLLATWLLTGLWHGSGLHYAVWGLANGAVLLLGTLLAGRPGPKLPKSLRVARTFLAGALIRVLFRAKDLATARAVYAGLFAFGSGTGLAGLGLDAADAAVAAVFLGMLILSDALAERGKKPAAPALRAVLAFAGVCALIVFGCYGPGYAPAEFFYARF